MKNKIFVFALFILSLIFIQTQLFSQVMTENFENNTLQWPIQDDDYVKIELTDGYYSIEHKIDESGWTIYYPVQIDSARDFTIQTVIRHDTGRNDAGYGLLWDMIDGSNYYAFDITDNGYYRIAQCIDGEWTDLTPWTICEHIYKGDLFNTLLIRKHNNEYYFIINNKIIDMHELALLGGSEVGFSVYLKQKVSVDELNIEYVDPNEHIKELNKFKELNPPDSTQDLLDWIEESF